MNTSKLLDLIEGPHKVYLGTTGGTASGEHTGVEFAVRPTNKNYIPLIKDDLLEENIVIVETRTPYPEPILSENTTPQHLIWLAEGLIQMIKDGARSIVIVHGTDMMDYVTRELDQESDYDPHREPDSLMGRLDSLRDELQQLIEEHAVRIVFTGSNTTDPDEIKRNLVGASETTKRRDISPGIYIYFDDDVVEGKYAIKDVYNGNSMRYAEDIDSDYSARLRKAKAEEGEKINNLAEKFGVSLLSSAPLSPEPLAQGRVSVDEENATIKRLRRFHLAFPSEQHPVHIYDATKFRPHHNEMLEGTVRDGVRAVILRIFHSGTANTDRTNSPELAVDKMVEDIRAEARAQGQEVVFFAVSENNEPVTLAEYETSVKLREAGIVPLYDTTMMLAYFKLYHLITACRTPKQLIRAMLQNFAGELTQELVNIEHEDALCAQYDCEWQLPHQSTLTE